jgi:acetylornithine deacetylase/succinyl-diaminopimelate desuccinylase-like protein
LLVAITRELSAEFIVTEPVAMAPEATAILRAAVASLGLTPVELVSGAGHDAGVLARSGVDAGLLFVRSLNGGASHSPDELSSAEDIALGIDALSDALRRLSAR